MRVVVKATERRIGGTDMKRQYYIGISLFITIIILVLDQITKFIIAKDGNVVKKLAPKDSPKKVETVFQNLL